ncbi:hypothetical protein GCM10008904_21380 [Paraclostridium ghonii]|uniref:Glyoxylase-like metal-dependent hydrolase (Beta-lactamase superfamily II) n=1 Tax=Paraclostridium ghonii TaxID=29358 RepID=A0ABU0N051_9FIRM|nr:MBL fold metallo-hydrolase [Paeniclostridium ghonii]MDQ0556530.1 glyoxylase-like metal-dependent hydrolase (beta-lactamase superfamily II) [Paeniclostridium ghonii]
MGIKEITNKYILTSLKNEVISKEVAGELIRGFNFNENILKNAEGSLNIDAINQLLDNIVSNYSQKDKFNFENFNIVRNYLVNISNVFNYYGNHYFVMLDNEKVIYKKHMYCQVVCSNSYIFISNGEGIMIDAGVNVDEILRCLDEFNIKLKYILITHGHTDHLFTACEIKNITGAKIVFSSKEITTIEKDCNTNFSANNVDVFVEDGDMVKFNEYDIKVIETPGHTRGSVCYKINNHLFTGDTLLKAAVGVTDYDNCNVKTVDSIKSKILTLSDDVYIYPGHGNISTLKEERANNLYLR